MRTILCLAFCVVFASAVNPIRDLASASNILNIQDLHSFEGQYELTTSYTFSNDGYPDPSDQVLVKGIYNLLTVVDGQTKVKTGSFENTTTLSTETPVSVSGTGAFSARGDASAQTGSFNGASTEEFTVDQDEVPVNGVKSEEFSAVIGGKKFTGHGHAEVDTWQDVNTSSSITDYEFNGQTNDDFREFSGNSTYFADITNVDSNQYAITSDTSFIGTLEGNHYYVFGPYNLTVFNSTGDEIYNRAGRFERNGTAPFIPDLFISQ